MKKLKCLGNVLLLMLLPLVLFGVIWVVIIFNTDVEDNDVVAKSWQSVFWIPFVFLYYKKSHLAFNLTKNSLNLKLSIISLFLGGVFVSSSLACSFMFHRHNAENVPIFCYVCAILVAPFVEELFYRKWIITYLEKHGFHDISIMLFTSFLFYFIHWLAVIYPFWYYRFDTFFMGIIQYALYKKTGDIRYCIMAHVSSNVIASFY